MNQSHRAPQLPRRTFLATAGLAVLTPLAQASAPHVRSFMKVTVSGTGDAYQGVVAHFRLPDNSRLPFFAWKAGGATTSFTMPLTEEGLQFTVEGKTPIELTLGGSSGTRLAEGKHTLTHEDGKSRLQVTVEPA